MSARNGIGGHQSARMVTDEWLSPPEIVQSFGSFDLDPCSPEQRPWDTAITHYTKQDDGLLLPWFGRVWLNPPYGNQIPRWMEKMALHQDGIALIFARTETEFFQRYVFGAADSILFIRKRLTFYTAQGKRGRFNGGAPSVLISYGSANVEALADSKIVGKHVLINAVPVIVVGTNPSWKNLVQIALIRLGRKGSVEQVYTMAELIAPEKTTANKHYREKIRQKLQEGFDRISRGVYSMKELKHDRPAKPSTPNTLGQAPEGYKMLIAE